MLCRPISKRKFVVTGSSGFRNIKSVNQKRPSKRLEKQVEQGQESRLNQTQVSLKTSSFIFKRFSTTCDNKPISKNDEASDMDVEVALQYNDDYYESVHCFANNITNPEGGAHLIGFRSALK